MSAPSTTISPAIAIEASTPALTTPYIFPTECSIIYNLTSASTAYQFFASLSENYLYVDTADSQWSSCQPPGRSAIDDHFHQTAYSGIVCPSGWTAWSLGLQSKYINPSSSSTWSTAFCCGHGHTLVDDIWSIYAPSYNNKICIETFPPSPSPAPSNSPSASPLIFTTASTNSSYPFFVEVAQATTITLPASALFDSPSTITSTGTTRIFSAATLVPVITTFTGRAFYPPWRIHWDASDNPTSDPPWPTLRDGMVLSSWVPGEEVEDGRWDDTGEERGLMVSVGYERAWALPVMIVLGVLLGLSLVGLGVLGWRVRKLKRERERRWDVKDDEIGGNGNMNGNGNGNGNVHGAPAGGHARKVSLSNGQRAQVIDVRRSRRSNPLDNGQDLPREGLR